MNDLKPFDILTAELSGTNLIEASAGTGKTYTITGLYLRLIVEKHLKVDQILVVTFTKAATEELKHRIRSKLLLAREAFKTGGSDDPMLDRIVGKHGGGGAASTRIDDAIRDFDACAIFTIHGFCQRVLHENAFETGSLFDTELITDQQRMLRSVCEDYWRRMLYEAEPEVVGFTLSKLKGPKKLIDLLNKSRNSALRIIPEVEKPLLDSLEAFRACSRELVNDWPGPMADVRCLLMDDRLNANSYGSLKRRKGQTGPPPREKMVNRLLDSVDVFCGQPSLRFPLFKEFGKLRASFIQEKTKKNFEPPRHTFFEQCEILCIANENLSSEMNAWLLYFKTDFFHFAKKRLVRLKKNQNVQYFDDLLIRLNDALEKESGDLLAAAVRERFRAALVDEFQDTDMLQYSIFARLFSGRNRLLFMIGDPKQAIYGFRGADIFSYLKASVDTQSRYTLKTNYRSRPGLIAAVNAIFSQVQNPFVFEMIPYVESSAPENPRKPKDGSADDFRLWFVDSDTGKPLNKADAEKKVTQAMAGEISRLIRGPDSLNPGDIAVLVRTNFQAEAVKQHLSGKNIPAVVYSAGNVFETRESRDLFLVLSGISDPSDPGCFKAALATSLLGSQITIPVLDNGGHAEQGAMFVRFLEYRRIWQKGGFIRMFNQFLSQENVRSRLLEMPDGERRLTNVLHIAELLHTCAVGKRLSAEGLLEWFSVQRDPASEMPDTHQIRLESDARAIKIITIHKSKGLEFPVVFCPFAWGSSKIHGTDFTFHDPDADQRLTLDLGSAMLEDHRQMAQYELLAENLRLLYVAVTRARSRCYLAWGRINEAGSSALAYLLHYKKREAETLESSLLEEIQHQYKMKTGQMLLDDLENLADTCGSSMRVSKLPHDTTLQNVSDPEPEETLSRREFNMPIERSWRIASYSSLISARTPDNELPDRDEQTGAPENETGLEKPAAQLKGRDGQSIFEFPKGPAAGIFFHEIFENIDFTLKDADHFSQVVLHKLNQHGFDVMWRETVERMIHQVLKVKLETGSGAFRLSSLTNADRVNEMEFYFPLRKIRPDLLQRIFERCDGKRGIPQFSERLGRLQFAPSKGFMKGYIDLVFCQNSRYYLIDWKSNHLGDTPGHYGHRQLAASMEKSLYILQYHIYTLALHLYLMHRLPGYRYERDFGGVFYIFLRGVDSSTGADTGVFYDRPQSEVVDALGRELIPGYVKI